MRTDRHCRRCGYCLADRGIKTNRSQSRQVKPRIPPQPSDQQYAFPDLVSSNDKRQGPQQHSERQQSDQPKTGDRKCRDPAEDDGRKHRDAPQRPAPRRIKCRYFHSHRPLASHYHTSMPFPLNVMIAVCESAINRGVTATSFHKIFFSGTLSNRVIST